MQTQFTLTQLAAELESRASSKQDFVVDTRALEMETNGNLVINSQPIIASRVDAGDQIILPVNDIAHGQIASRLNIPAAYYSKMREQAPALLADNVNHWFQKNPEKRLVRSLNGNARAFLSDRYQRIENEEIASVVLPQLLEHEGVEIKSCAITESRMYIKAVFSRIQGEVVKGDVVQAGIVISNSEVGQGAVKIQPLVYRLVCENGMVIEDAKYTARHVGGRISAQEDIYEMLSNETIAADDRAIMLKVRDVVRASFDEARFASRLSAMQETTTQKIIGNPAESIKLLAKKFSFNEFEQGSILRHLIEGGDTSRWGVLNAVTRTAQDIEDYDRATQLETAGGNILTFPRKEWDQVAMAIAA